MRLIILLLLAGTVTSVFAQDQTIPNGIYSTHYAMANEQPIPGYSIDYKKQPDSTDTVIRFSNLRVKPRLKSGKRFIWGFSDGKDFYINSSSYDPEGPVRYSKVLYKGNRYIYFRENMSLALTKKRSLAALDLQTGKYFMINRDNMEEILETDPELLTEFNNNADQKSEYAEYLTRFDERNYRQ